MALMSARSFLCSRSTQVSPAEIPRNLYLKGLCFAYYIYREVTTLVCNCNALSLLKAGYFFLRMLVDPVFCSV